MTIETYAEMNIEVVKILRFGDDATLHYAAQRIEELEAEVEWLQTEIESRTRLRQCKVCKAMIVDSQPAPDALPCGHPRLPERGQARSALRGDVTQWCSECEKEAR